MTIFTQANPESDPESPRTVEQITRKHVQRMRDALGKRNLSNQTRNKRIAGMSILFGQAVREFWVQSNPTNGVKFEVKDGDRKKRKAFERDEIKAWMNHPCFSQHQFDAYGWSEFWIPLLCLWHGARRNEIGHLLTSDIRKIDGIWIINIDGRVGGGDGKKIKTAASRREIPLHPKLIEIGFLRWYRTLSPGRLFDNCPIERDGSIGCISKIVRAQLDQVGADSELQPSFYSAYVPDPAARFSHPERDHRCDCRPCPDQSRGTIRGCTAAHEAEGDLPDQSRVAAQALRNEPSPLGIASLVPISEYAQA